MFQQIMALKALLYVTTANTRDYRMDEQASLWNYGQYNGTGRDLRAGYSQTFSVPATRKKKQLVSSQKFRSLIVIDNFSMQCSSLEQLVHNNLKYGIEKIGVIDLKECSSLVYSSEDSVRETYAVPLQKWALRLFHYLAPRLQNPLILRQRAEVGIWVGMLFVGQHLGNQVCCMRVHDYL